MTTPYVLKGKMTLTRKLKLELLQRTGKSSDEWRVLYRQGVVVVRLTDLTDDELEQEKVHLSRTLAFAKRMTTNQALQDDLKHELEVTEKEIERRTTLTH